VTLIETPDSMLYVQIDGGAHGPFSVDQMAKLEALGKLNSDVPVAVVGATTWTTWGEQQARIVTMQTPFVAPTLLAQPVSVISGYSPEFALVAQDPVLQSLQPMLGVIELERKGTLAGSQCLGCGSSDAPLTKQRLTEQKGGLAIGAAGAVIMLIRLLTAKRTQIHYPMCERCGGWNMNRVKIGIGVALASVLLFLTGPVVFSTPSWHTASHTLGVIGTIVGLLFAVNRQPFFSVLGITKTHATVRQNPKWKIPK
jgi:hypothetical protein